ncbi:MAG: hypothetical protein ACLGSD_13830 [Acidobacteriota bacterium]
MKVAGSKVKTLRGRPFLDLVTIVALDRPYAVEDLAKVFKVAPRTVEETMATPAFSAAVDRSRRIRRAMAERGI